MTRLINCLGMNISGDWNVKPQTKQSKTKHVEGRILYQTSTCNWYQYNANIIVSAICIFMNVYGLH